MNNPFSERVRVRFAPSPTGLLHIGSLRTALYNELFANHNSGDFILRIEDTDRKREVKDGIENICRSLEKCGVIPNEGVWLDKKGKVIQRGDHGPYIQTERQSKHLDYAKELINKGKAYYCFCTSDRLDKLREQQQLAKKPTMYDGMCRGLTIEESLKRVEAGEEHVIRLKLPKQGSVVVHDLIRGDVTFEWLLIDDQVIIKSDGFPTYHLAATADDHDMEITHVLRAEEWLPSTPKHLFIYQALDWKPPEFAHLPLLLNTDKSKLSKRQGDVAVDDYLAKGYLPDAIINFIALLGWNPSGEREIYSHSELVELFDITKINLSGAVFNLEKLDWLNSQYIRNIEKDEYLSLVSPYVKDKTDDPEFADRALLLIRDRVMKLPDVESLTEFFFKEHLDYSKVSLSWKTQSASETVDRLKAVLSCVKEMSDSEAQDAIVVETSIKKLIADKGWGNGDTLWPLRVALSGMDKSPGPFELVATYGKKRTIDRINDALASLKTK
jgi:glutamyl-tRNA synthetase